MWQVCLLDNVFMKYRKKPVIIEAIQWTGKNKKEIKEFVGSMAEFEIAELKDNKLYYLFINTLEGRMEASEGDYIIKGVNGEFYPCKPDIFDKTYEKV